jgi:hypothetical protein
MGGAGGTAGTAPGWRGLTRVEDRVRDWVTGAGLAGPQLGHALC